ncbi:restriction endonuclease subunit S [Weissella paramesenteroides]
MVPFVINFVLSINLRFSQDDTSNTFQYFIDTWEKRKLGELTKRVTRKNINNESTLPLTISAQYGLIDQNIFFDKQVASKDVSSYFLIKNGEFAYNKSYSNGYPLGAIKRLDRYPNGVLSTLYIIFKPISVSSQFLVSYFDSTHWYKEVAKNAAEGARNHGLLNISPSDFFNMVQTIPNNFEEQNKVGIFFETLDNIIAVNQGSNYFFDKSMCFHLRSKKSISFN